MPSIVRDVHVENLLSGRRMLVEWSLNPSVEVVTVYEIWRSTMEYQGFEKIAQVSAPTYQYIDKVPYTFGIVYFYKVIGRDNSGLVSDLNASNAVQDSTFDNFEERPFRATMVTYDSFVKGEVPTGTKNSINTSFATAALFRFATVEVFVNGLALVRGVGFTENANQQAITLTVAPAPSATLLVNYIAV
jgi:hypothetical protein